MALIGLIGLHVTQYMYVLFDKVHIYIQKTHQCKHMFCLQTYPVKVQRATSIYFFACHMSSIKLTDVIQTVLETKVFSIQHY